MRGRLLRALRGWQKLTVLIGKYLNWMCFMIYRFSGLFVVVSTLLGCAGMGGNDSPANVADEYQQLNPTDAVVAIAKRYYNDVYLQDKYNYITVDVDEYAAIQVINTTRAYCARRNGRVANWPLKKGSFNCLRSNGEMDFSISLESGLMHDFGVSVLEHTAENKDVYDLFLSTMGYMSPQRVLDEQKKQQDAALAAKRKADEELRAQRLSNRQQVSSVGASVCQSGSYSGSPMVLFGTVEQVAGERLKVFVERAILPRTPGISPGGFKQHYVWVNFMDVEPCSLVRN